MLIVRPVEEKDLPALMVLAGKTGAGLTTLPEHEPSLAEKIADSKRAFTAPIGTQEKLSYLLVLEDTEQGVIAGTSAIKAGVGLDRPFYSYRLLHITQVSHEPEMRVDTELLQLSNDFVGATEVATLFLAPEYRRDNLGRLLSKARYLLMAAHSRRFSERVISEIRGWVDSDDHSPFWDAIGRHFFGMDFADADRVNGEGNSQFIADLMPKFPIYTALLPEDARSVIGRPHEGARPAIRLLEKEGFRFSGAVDIFDAGPLMEVSRHGIQTVQNTRTGTFAGSVAGAAQDNLHMAANPDLQNFRVCLSNVVETDSGFWLPDMAAVSLDIGKGDTLIYAPVLESSV